MSTVPENNSSPQSTPESNPSTTTNEPPVEGQTPEGGTPETTTPDPIAPLTAESIKIPEGFTVDETVRDEFINIMNDDKLSKADLAQKLIDLQSNFAKSWDEAGTKAWEAQQEQWRNEVAADPEIGGAKQETVLAGIAKVVEEYGSPEVKEILTLTGAGNNIHLIKMMDKIAKALNEGGGHVNGNPPPEQKTVAQKLYPSMK